MWEQELTELGITIRKRDGEYRVNHIGGRQETAYYTNDLKDAVETAKLMAAGRSCGLTQ